MSLVSCSVSSNWNKYSIKNNKQYAMVNKQDVENTEIFVKLIKQIFNDLYREQWLFYMLLPVGRRRPGDVPWSFTKGPNIRNLQDLQGALQGPNTKFDDLIKKFSLDAIVLVLDICYCFLLEKKNSKFLNGDVHRTSTWLCCGMFWGSNAGTLWRCLPDVAPRCFLNSTHKHVNLILSGCSRLYSKL